MKVSIYIATHKPYPTLARPGFVPIQVGADLPGRVPFLPVRDNIGTNISARNDRYCELTAIYWALHNDADSDWIGLYHYRRYLWPNAGKLAFVSRHLTSHLPVVDSAAVEEIAGRGTGMIVPEAGVFPMSVREQYAGSHRVEDLDLAVSLIVGRDPRWRPFCERFLGGRSFRQYNMFVMRRDAFTECWRLLLEILREVEENIDFAKYPDAQQSRVIGFLSERLFSIWTDRFGTRFGAVERPVLSPETDPTVVSRVCGKALRMFRGM